MNVSTNCHKCGVPICMTLPDDADEWLIRFARRVICEACSERLYGPSKPPPRPHREALEVRLPYKD
jgi:hypothetical protein